MVGQLGRTWNIHKQFNPTLVSPELFPHRSRSGTRHRRSGSNDHVRGDLFGGFFGMDMPSARNYFDDGPRVASGGGGAARGNEQGWVEQGYEDLPFPDM